MLRNIYPSCTGACDWPLIYSASEQKPQTYKINKNYLQPNEAQEVLKVRA